jgi:hypothetical protein
MKEEIRIERKEAYKVWSRGEKKGQPKTLTDRVVRFLIEGLHFEEVPSKSRYRKFVKADRVYLVGKNGSVRDGRTVADSVSISTYIAKLASMWEQKKKA